MAKTLDYQITLYPAHRDGAFVVTQFQMLGSYPEKRIQAAIKRARGNDKEAKAGLPVVDALAALRPALSGQDAGAAASAFPAPSSRAGPSPGRSPRRFHPGRACSDSP